MMMMIMMMMMMVMIAILQPVDGFDNMSIILVWLMKVWWIFLAQFRNYDTASFK